jgi:hypothetical protein
MNVDAFRGQHTRARERAEEQSHRRHRSDWLGAPVRPVS